MHDLDITVTNHSPPLVGWQAGGHRVPPAEQRSPRRPNRAQAHRAQRQRIAADAAAMFRPPPARANGPPSADGLVDPVLALLAQQVRLLASLWGDGLPRHQRVWCVPRLRCVIVCQWQGITPGMRDGPRAPGLDAPGFWVEYAAPLPASENARCNVRCTSLPSALLESPSHAGDMEWLRD